MGNQVLILEPRDAPHAPTSETRKRVAALVACGLDHIQIAYVMELEPHQVKFHYKEELEHGLAMTNGQVGAALLRNCLAGDTNAQKFWLATRAGWAPPTPEEAKKNQTAAIQQEDKRKLMDEIVKIVAREKVVTEQGDTTAKANVGAGRVQ